MEIKITENEVEEIAKGYPNPMHMIPRESFEEQLKNYLCKCFGVESTTKIKKKEK